MDINFRQPQGYDEAPEMHYDSKAKAAIKMKMDRYVDTQKDIIQRMRELGNYVEIKEAILMIEEDAVCLIAGNPNRPSVFVFGDGHTTQNAENIARKYRTYIEKELEKRGQLYKEDSKD